MNGGGNAANRDIFDGGEVTVKSFNIAHLASGSEQAKVTAARASVGSGIHFIPAWSMILVFRGHLKVSL
jgi:hypothetical protein